MNTKLIFSLSAISLFAGTLFGENAVFNGSFELGTDGFALEKNGTRSIKNGFDAKKRIINKQEPKLLKLARKR